MSFWIRESKGYYDDKAATLKDGLVKVVVGIGIAAGVFYTCDGSKALRSDLDNIRSNKYRAMINEAKEKVKEAHPEWYFSYKPVEGLGKIVMGYNSKTPETLYLVGSAN